MATYMANMAPLDKIVPKAIMSNAIMLLAAVENELQNASSDIRLKKKQTEFIELMIEDFAASFEKRIMMLVVNSFILNSPIEIINGAWLQKLVESANASQFDQHTAELQSVFMMKTDAPQHRVKEVFLDYLISFRNRHNVHELAIEKLLINIRAA